MRLLLITPPTSLDELYGKLSEIGTLYPSLGLAYLASYAEKQGHEVKVIDSEAKKYNYEEINKLTLAFKPDIVGMQTYCTNLKKVYKVAENLKKILNIKIVLGGAQATLNPIKTLENKDIDFVIYGEGEKTLLELISKLKSKKFSKIKGLVYKDKGKIKINKPRELIQNLDELPLPAWHLFQVGKYKNPRMMARKNPVGTIGTSRGCVFGCTYCNKSVFGRKFRAKSAQRVVKEFEHLKKAGFNEVHVWDDMFSTDLKRAKQICKEMIKRKLNLTWQLECGVRVNCVDLEFFQLAKKAGCYKVAYGYESGNQKILDNMDKAIKLEDSINATKLAKQVGLEISGFFMFGLPGETIQTMEETINFACRLDPDMAKVTILVPFPSTPVFDDFKKQGLILSEDWTKYNFHTASKVYSHQNLDWQTLEKYYDLFYKRFYFRPSYIDRKSVV